MHFSGLARFHPQLTPPYMFQPGTGTKKICTAAGILVSAIESHALLLSANILLHRSGRSPEVRGMDTQGEV
jgi:hypothetical protein